MMETKYWITPEGFYAKLNGEFAFDFDPCPYPRPEDYNSLVLPWGKSNYVNPPFNKKDAPHGGPSAFVRKAIAERERGNSSVFVLPLPWNLGLLMAAGAELRYGGIVHWVDAETGKLCPRSAPQVIAVLTAHLGEETKGEASPGSGPSAVSPDESQEVLNFGS